MRILRILAMAACAAALGVAVTPGTTPLPPAKKKAKSVTAKKAPKKRYLSSAGAASSGKAGAGAGKTATSKKAPASPQAISKAPPKRTVKPGTKAPARAPPAAIKIRAQAHDVVFENVANGADLPVENPAALIPFFEQLYRHQQGEMPGPVRILHYGDSHTAADEWTGEMRARLQEKFGDGGSGYSFAGRPYNGYRREDVRSGSTSGWHTDGLVGRPGDGVYGLGGISMSVRTPREGIYVEADASDFELFYYQQPGGGSLQLYDNGVAVEQISTAGEPSPAYYRLEDMPGPHKLELETLDRAPVRLFGWVAEKPTGITYETLGINGAAASIILDWNEETLRSNIERRNPALIVLAYGTNEAGQKSWTLDSYRDMFQKLLARFRAAAPAATILVIGPPDRDQKTRRGWLPMDQLDMIVEAQRQAAVSSGCPFWDLRAKMGGKGSMLQWVAAGMAQNDHVHFTGAGYHMLGDAVVRDLMSQYDLFVKARGSVVAAQVAPPAEP
jgi:lysophospholipase L1-like esterase